MAEQDNPHNTLTGEPDDGNKMNVIASPHRAAPALAAQEPDDEADDSQVRASGSN